jgi:hypothetical protein
VEGAEEPASMTSAAGIIVLGTKRILIGGGGTGAPGVAEACRSGCRAICCCAAASSPRVASAISCCRDRSAAYAAYDSGSKRQIERQIEKGAETKKKKRPEIFTIKY